MTHCCPYCGGRYDFRYPQELQTLDLPPRLHLILLQLYKNRTRMVLPGEIAADIAPNSFHVYMHRIRHEMQLRRLDWYILSDSPGGRWRTKSRYQLKKRGEENAEAGAAERSEAVHS